MAKLHKLFPIISHPIDFCAHGLRKKKKGGMEEVRVVKIMRKAKRRGTFSAEKSARNEGSVSNATKQTKTDDFATPEQ